MKGFVTKGFVTKGFVMKGFVMKGMKRSHGTGVNELSDYWLCETNWIKIRRLLLDWNKTGFDEAV